MADGAGGDTRLWVGSALLPGVVHCRFQPLFTSASPTCVDFSENGDVTIFPSPRLGPSVPLARDGDNVDLLVEDRLPSTVAVREGRPTACFSELGSRIVTFWACKDGQEASASLGYIGDCSWHEMSALTVNNSLISLLHCRNVSVTAFICNQSTAVSDPDLFNSGQSDLQPGEHTAPDRYERRTGRD